MIKEFFTLFAAPVIDTSGSGIPTKSADSVLSNALDIVWFVMGFVAVVVIVISGYQFLTSNGDPAKAAKARQTLLYAIIGLVVAISAFAITKFVIGRF